MKKLRILVVPANEGGCAYYRAIMPFEKLQDLCSDRVEVRMDKNPLGVDEGKGNWKPNWEFENLKWCDVVVVSNISNFGGQYTARIIGKAKEFGKFVHFDTDDLLTDLYDDHRLKKVYEEKGLSQITMHMYNSSDLVTVTQNKFAKRVKPYINGALAVIKNSIDYNLPCWNVPRKPDSKVVRIGWAGGIHHDPDVREFAVVTHIVNQKVGSEKIWWDFYGHPPNVDKDDWQVDVWKGYKKHLVGAMKGRKNWSIHYAMPPHTYGGMFANMDIAIAPLQMNAFNDSKSEIKVAECGRYGVPLVASNVGCYDETIKNWENGYLIPPKASKMVWTKVLTKLIKEHSLRKRMGQNLKKITDEVFDINKVVHQRIDLYEECFKALKFDPRDNRSESNIHS